ncbi:MAG: DUF3052 family protein [Candidatus Eisenbacteria bacterium]|uniref:DUF3052 family protein n=1 Tax=Eiseniibacteriota bacterium TaxID=2212470 RepID=A0A956RNL6_UNCEI|nr:DUF3052 family protein [Candidatus Eisenbacteria bacterium]
MPADHGTGYSGTPLARKLGIKAGARLVVLGEPPEYRQWLEPLPAEVVFGKRIGKGVDLVHLFVTEKKVLETRLRDLRERLEPAAVVWVSWPKKSSKVPSTVTEDTVRELALPLGFVDVKVCAVDPAWSGLKLVVRKSLR